ncbi:hypothetical protein [Rathayibacter caricis]|uniref:hypothetical protein n=1 Tax=Rathayibacter caricis TaxID=110936 RepID=UPI0011B1D90C|nr:hypothetical protein [Rathayibacter caricis]
MSKTDINENLEVAPVEDIETEAVEEVLVEDVSDEILVHFYQGVSIPNPASPMGKPLTFGRGQEVVLTPDLLDELKDRFGNFPAWVENLAEPDPFAEEEPIAALGSWPEDKSPFIRGELAWLDERRRRLGAALDIADPIERQKAVVAINRELGLAVPDNHNVYNY